MSTRISHPLKLRQVGQTLFRRLQRCFGGSDWSTRGPSPLSPNHLCDGVVQGDGRSGALLRLVEVCTGDGPSGSFSHLHREDPSQREDWDLGHACSWYPAGGPDTNRWDTLFPSHLTSIESTSRRRCLCTCRTPRRWNIRQSTCTSAWLFEVKEDVFRSCRFKAEIFSFQSEALNATSQYISSQQNIKQLTPQPVQSSLIPAAIPGGAKLISGSYSCFPNLLGHSQLLISLVLPLGVPLWWKRRSKKLFFWQKTPPKIWPLLVQSLALDFPKPLLPFVQGSHYMQLQRTFSRRKAVNLCCNFFFFFFFSQWTELPLSSSGFRLRGMWSWSFSGGAASAATLPPSYVQPEGYVPTLIQEHRQNQLAYILHRRSTVRPPSPIRTLLLWGWLG